MIGWEGGHLEKSAAVPSWNRLVLRFLMPCSRTRITSS